jgi:uncharacterized protein (DUF1800 family)
VDATIRRLGMLGESFEGAAAGRGFRTLARMWIAAAGLCAALVSTAALAVDASPVYRFYNNRTGTHFYTISGAERDTVLNNYPWFAYEGAVYWAYTGAEAGTLPVYRFYNKNTGTHFYTQSETEKNYVLATYPVFVFEGPVYYAPPAADQGGSTALFRFYNTRTGAHFYTTSANERDKVLATWPWFAYESVAYYVFTSPNPPSGGGTNTPPKATLSASATSVGVPATVTLSAQASDDDGTIAKVQFYNGSTMMGEVSSAPFSLNYTIPVAGTYNFSALAIDDKGASGASNTVQVTASAGGGGPPGNVAPKVALSSNTNTITIPGSATLSANATDQDGSIANVKFYNGTSLVSTVSAPPYTYTYTTSVAGTANFTAVAQDNVGATTTSNAVAIVAQAPPGGGGGIVAPKLTFNVSSTLVAAPSTITLTASNVTSTGGTITRVSFYMNGTKLIDKPTSPYTFTATIPSTGTYQFTAEAADSGGNTHMTLPISVTGAGMPPSGTIPADTWRLLQQATFGPTYAEAQRVQSLGIAGWIDNQFTQPVSGYPDSKYNRIQLKTSLDCTTQDPSKANYPADHPYAQCVRDHLSLAMVQRDFFTNAVYAPDQLRQRVAWALSQIIVTSANEPDLSYAYVMSRFQNLMFNNAFGNYRTLLDQVTYSPAMGNYLDAVNNDRPSGTKVPNENYAREIMQLFSIGLNELNADGTEILDANGMPVPTYDQNDIKEFAKVFTGMTYADPANPTATTATKKNGVYYALPMIPYPVTATAGHEQSAKTLLNGTVLPAGQTIQKDLQDAVLNVFMHPNTPVYIGKQLIQRLVTGNPSPAYVQRIANVFVNNGSGVRGDLKAVVKAILMDPEARGGGSASDPTYGSLKEPVLMITNLIRSLTGVTDGNRLEGFASGLGQRPYFSPTVFNYFPPDQTIQGTSILAPEFLIHTTQTAIARSNLVYNMVYNPTGVDNTLSNSTGTRLNITQFESLAADPAALVDKVDLVLTGGQMPSAAKATIATAVGAVGATNTFARAQMAVFLTASSYYYQVQH